MKTSYSGRQLLLISALAMMSLDASAIMTIKPKPVEPGHQHHRGMGKSFVLTGFENSEVKLILPTLENKKLDIKNGLIPFKPTGMDNYHVLLATRDNNNVEESAIRYVYSFGKPSGHSPEELTELDKVTLEIVPDPIPREHWHYKAGSEAAFIIRYQQQPLANASVSLSTSKASIVTTTTDTEGRAVFTIPDDYKVETAGRRANPRIEMLVHVKHENNGKQYATWLSADYEANPEQWKSTEMGALLAAGGFIFGISLTGLGTKTSSKKRGDK